MKFKHLLRLSHLIAIACAIFPARGIIIQQSPTSQTIVWEAEDVTTLTNGAPTAFILKDDAPASGGKALYQQGPDQNTAVPVSLATYQIRFTTPGTYNLYVRWRGDAARNSVDANGANSYYAPNTFGELSPDVANYRVSSANNSRIPPEALNYAWIREAGGTFDVTQADVDGKTNFVVTIGTREWGMFIDKLAFSLDAALTDAALTGLPNSESSVIAQGATDTFVAWEGERVSHITNGSPTFLVIKDDAPASGGSALYQQGPDQNTAVPVSFATYRLTFKTPGTYNLYVRWRGDAARNSVDANGANSYYAPNSFGDLSPDVANYRVSSANNSRIPPEALNYAWIREAGGTFEITQADVDAGTQIYLKIGSREWGMFLDRFVLSLDGALTDSQLTALPNSGAGSRPVVRKLVGSAALNNVRITFDRAIDPASVQASDFTLSGNVLVTAAEVDANNPIDVVLTTAAQTPGTVYTVTINTISDVAGASILANSTGNFSAWRLASGWALMEFYSGVTGLTIEDLQANPKFPSQPNASQLVRRVFTFNDPFQDNYGMRFTTFFVPPQAGAYEFYLLGNDDAELALSTDTTEANLTPVLRSGSGLTTFDPSIMFTTPVLAAGQRYLLRATLQEGTGDSLLSLAARRVGDTTPLEALKPLSGDLIATFVNPDAGAITFRRQPANQTAGANARATFSVDAVSPAGAPVFYQWQVNGADIPGATRAEYITPILTAADTGKTYRVIVSANGNSVPSAGATLTVGPAVTPTVAPYIGINFVGGGNGNNGGSLAPEDVAGVVPQNNFNDLPGNVFTDTPLKDANGAPTPVTLTVDAATIIGNGAGTATANQALMQGYIHNNNTPMVVRLLNVPADTYNLIVYSLGFDFNTVFNETVSLEGGATYPVFTVRAQDVGDYSPNPVFVEMDSIDPANRDIGNYLVYRNITPAPDGSLVLTLTPEAEAPGINYLPPVNALQLVRVLPVAPALTAVRTSATALTINWPAAAAGYRLESSAELGAAASWSAVAGAPNPITGAGSTSVTIPSTGNRFFRLVK